MAFDVYSVELLGLVCGQPCANVLHFKGGEEAGDNPIAGANALIDALGAPVTAGTYFKEYLDCLPENYTLKGCRVRRINSTGGPNVARVMGAAPGNRPGDADVSGFGPVGLYHCGEVVDVWVTGKIFFPGCSIDDVSENEFSGDLETQINVFLALSLTSIGAGPIGPFQQVVWSPTGLVPLPIIDHSMSIKVGTQRRRYVPL